ncbi:MAG: DUF4136 domain-containing protein [Novosphingobium sp.]
MRSRFAAPLAALALLSGCIAPVGPIEVTRFHAPDTAALARGTITVEAAPGADAASLELKSYQSAVSQQLQRIGYSEAGAGDQVALVKLIRSRLRPARSSGPVSVGVGGSTGSYGSGVGLGIGLNLSGPPPEQVETQLSVSIRERASGKVLWEGRAMFTVSAKSPLADTALAAPKMAEALFRGFPGNSGETIEVR